MIQTICFWFLFEFVPKGKEGSSSRKTEENIVASALGWRRCLVEVHRQRGEHRKALRAQRALKRACWIAQACGFEAQVKKLRREYFKKRKKILF